MPDFSPVGAVVSLFIHTEFLKQYHFMVDLKILNCDNSVPNWAMKFKLVPL
jgi:hypothetical protein